VSVVFRALSPLADLEQQLEEANISDLPPAAKIRKLRALRSDFASLTDRADQYIADAELIREAEARGMMEAVVQVRENADIRAVLVERGMAEPDKLDELGYLSHEELDRLREEGRLFEFAEQIQEAFGQVKFDPDLHPRDRLGKFRDVLGGLAPGKGIRLPSGVQVKREKSGFTVSGKGVQAQRAANVRDAAERGLQRHDNLRGASGVAIAKAPTLPAKGRGRRSRPRILDTHAPGREEPGLEIEGDYIDVGGDIERAAQLLGEGKKVRLNQPREASVLIERLGEIAQKAQERGDKAPMYDLCNVSVAGTNLFCVQSKGVPRVEMPQLTGLPVPGGKADKLPKDSRGRVNLGDNFLDHMRKLGYDLGHDQETASYLRPTQRELNGAKVAAMMNAMDAGAVVPERLFVSNDGYIVDGHHRWAADVGRALRDGDEADKQLPIHRIDLDIGTLLDEARQYTEDMGLQPKQAGDIGTAPGQVPEGQMPTPSGPAQEIEWLGGPDREPTMEEIAADLETARRIGLSDWPPVSALARHLFDGEKDSFDRYVRVLPNGKEVVIDPARQEMHDKLIDTLLRRRKPVTNARGEIEYVPDENGEELKPHPDGKRVLFMGGGTASGKSTALAMQGNEDVQPPDSVMIDADELKGLLEEYQRMVGEGDRYAASALHEESSYLAKRLRNEAAEKGLNMIVDGTANSSIKKFEEKLTQAKNEGYKVSMFYVNAPTDVAVIRATKRAQESGRWVPEPEIRKVHSGVSHVFANQVRDLAERGFFDDIRGFDTFGKPPTKMFHLDENGKFTVLDETKYGAFVDKQHEVKFE
jgi:predicted ABC-type ATPase